MVNFTLDQLKEAMKNQQNIRNISVIAHVDHGKSTLTDSLVIKCGLMSENKRGDRMTDTLELEKEKGITIKSTGISLFFEYEKEETKKDQYVINLIDSPGHVDFSSEVTAALRVTDGALVVVDYIEGVCIQTETVLRQSLLELIRPVLMINKVDRAIFELEQNSESIYLQFRKVIENFNVIVSTYQRENEIGDCQVCPIKGQVCFGSAIQGWGFTIHTFAKILSKKYGLKLESITNKLWGDHFYDKENSKFITKNSLDVVDHEKYPRAFCHLIMDPIISLLRCIYKGDVNGWNEQLKKFGIEIEIEKELLEDRKKLVSKIMQSFIDTSDAIVEMIILHLPSPKESQKYRTDYLYEGPTDDECSISMKNCDPSGSFMMYVSKMIPTSIDGRFYAFGRVFSGCAEKSKKIKIMGPNYKLGDSKDMFEKSITKVVTMIGKKEQEIDSVPCGNTCAIMGVDNCIVKQGTLSDNWNACTIRSLKFSVSPIVRISVAPKKPSEMAKMIEGMKKLIQTDSIAEIITNENENVIAGCGELHLEILLSDLRRLSNIEIVTSQPLVPYQETVTTKSSQVCMAKSGNKHNRLFTVAEPLHEGIVKEINEGTISSNTDAKALSRKLQDDYQWEANESKKIWSFGPNYTGPNVLVDNTKATQYLSEIQDSVVEAFQWASNKGVLCEENLTGVKFNIVEAVIHTDRAHRGSSQIIPCARRSFLASELSAEPKLVEPIYSVDISSNIKTLGAIYQIIGKRKGIVLGEEYIEGTPLVNIKTYLPVAKSFGLNSELRAATSGNAFAQLVLDHWETIKENPLEKNNESNQLMMEIRKRKGLKLEAPILSDYIDKL